eukprot:785918-Prorocentrum_minimum.AAC.2
MHSLYLRWGCKPSTGPPRNAPARPPPPPGWGAPRWRPPIGCSHPIGCTITPSVGRPRARRSARAPRGRRQLSSRSRPALHLRSLFAPRGARRRSSEPPSRRPADGRC